MKLYAQFFNKGVMTGEPVEACGVDGVMVLDARYNTMAHYAKVKRHAKKHGYIGFQFVKATRFTNGGQRSKLVLV